MKGVTSPPKRFGAKESKSNNTVYQAATDGFVVARAVVYSARLVGLTDGSNPPTTEMSAAKDNGGNQAEATVPLFVKKNNYWKITSTGSPVIYWIPLK